MLGFLFFFFFFGFRGGGCPGITHLSLFCSRFLDFRRSSSLSFEDMEEPARGGDLGELFVRASVRSGLCVVGVVAGLMEYGVVEGSARRSLKEEEYDSAWLCPHCDDGKSECYIVYFPPKVCNLQMRCCLRCHNQSRWKGWPTLQRELMNSV